MLKGLILHIIAKIAFVLCTYGIHLFLGKNLSAVEYGQVGVVISIITVNYNFLSNGIRQAEAKLLALSKYDEVNLVKKGLLGQGSVALVLTTINFFLAEEISSLLNAPDMTLYIKLSALLIPFTAGYFLFVGIINGKRKFAIEAFIVTIYPIMRLTVIPFVVLGHDKPAGVVYGFLSAAIVGFLLSAIYLIYKKNSFIIRDNKCPNKLFGKYIVDFLVFFTCITIILNIDMLFSNALVKDHRYIGYYTGAVNLAKVTYYLLSAIYLVILPTITVHVSRGHISKAKDTISALFNIIGIFIAPIMIILAATSSCILELFYLPEYSEISVTTSVLIFSQFLIGIFVIGNMCIIAASSRLFSTILSIFITLFDGLFCYVFISTFGIFGAAFATMLSGLIGIVLTQIKLQHIYGKLHDTFFVKIVVANIILFISTSIIFYKLEHLISNLFILCLIYFAIYTVFILLLCITNANDVKNNLTKIIKK